MTTLERHTLAVKPAGAWALDETRDLPTLAKDLASDPLPIPADDETPRPMALALNRSVDALPDDVRRLFTALAAFATVEIGREAVLALARELGLSDPESSAGLLVRRALLDAFVNEEMPPESDRERRKLHALLRAASQKLFASWSADQQEATRSAIAA